MLPLTTHTIVKNEDRFILQALESVVWYASQMLIIDTGSQDQTIPLIKQFIARHPGKQIHFTQQKVENPQQITQLRNQQIKQTKTDWFLLLDGDEIWPKSQLFKLLQQVNDFAPTVLALVNQTRNCVGDIYHYLPPEFGHYQLKGHTGHLNIRLMKNANPVVKGVYPNEGYYYQNKLINHQPNWLEYSNAWYLHTTHLARSSNQQPTFGRRQTIFARGIPLPKQEIPEVLFSAKSEVFYDITRPRSKWFELLAGITDIFRKLKNLSK